MRVHTQALPWTEPLLAAVRVQGRLLGANTVRFYESEDLAVNGSVVSCDAYILLSGDPEHNIWVPDESAPTDESGLPEMYWAEAPPEVFVSFLNRGYPHFRFFHE